MSAKSELTPDELELVWRKVAEAITAAGEEKESVLLAKLVLLLANEVRDTETLESLIAIAGRDLD